MQNVYINHDDREYVKKLIKRINPSCSFSIPRYLYRYRGLSDYSVEDIVNGEATMSRPKYMNDIFDSIGIAKQEITTEDMALLSQYLPKDGIDVFMESIKKINDIKAVFPQQCLHILSLTEKGNDEHMWSIYGAEHKGFCVRYDVTLLPEKVQRCLFPVTYIQDNTEVYLPVLDEDSENFINDIYVSSLVKNDVWKQEKEWRIIFHSIYNIEYLPIIWKSSSICFGARCSEEYLSETERKNVIRILEYCSNNDVPIEKVNSNYRGRGLEIRQYTPYEYAELFL